MRKAYWFQNDLRVADNAGLCAAAEGADELLCVYVLHSAPGWCNVVGKGGQRLRFELESLHSLHAALESRGQRLLLIEGDPARLLPTLLRTQRVGELHCSREAGTREAAVIARVRRQLPALTLRTHASRGLFSDAELPMALADLPRQFTPFRDAMAQVPVAEPMAAPAQLPPPPRISYRALPAIDTEPHPAYALRGGSGAAHSHLRQYLFADQAVKTYKETRNALDGENFSSGLSGWLANGCLSPRQVVQQLRLFEGSVARNDSTEWLYVELLWREFFYWRAIIDGALLFAPYGVARRKQLRSFEPRAFARWCAGDTPWPLVNALMRQLLATGWMSNRGRQIVASALVNELGLDWRYGAAFFEKHLLDFDVASNYGNWQYIAGVGCDPRGGRHFNLARQAEQFDADGDFVRRWGGVRPVQAMHAVDAADWPLDAET